jgi:DNA-binding transcriptional LysR family regulator
MDLRRARTFVTVADLGTVSAAAQQLRIAQPALSRQISDLEHELGLKLFDRAGRRLLLTSDGEQLLDDCRGLLNLASAVGEHARSLRQGDTGVLKVAFAPPILESVIPDFLHRYAKRFPDVQVKLVDAVGPKLLAMLERGEIHLAQGAVNAIQADDRRFANQPLGFLEVLAAGHPRLFHAEGNTIDVGELAAYPLLLLNSDFLQRRTFDAASRMVGMRPDILIESGAPHALVAMAAAGHGVALFPSALRIRDLKLRIVAVTYRGKALREPLAIFWDKRRHRTHYAIAFCEMLAEYLREVYPIARPTAPARKGKGSRTQARRSRAERSSTAPSIKRL